MTDHQIQIAALVVNVAALVALVVYVLETRRIRQAAQDQIEGLAKPCLTLFAKLRDPDEAILEMNGAVGGTVVADNDGNFVVFNIGTGVALNVNYQFRNLDRPDAISKGPKLFCQRTPRPTGQDAGTNERFYVLRQLRGGISIREHRR
jgi:hypothetical protein